MQVKVVLTITSSVPPSSLADMLFVHLLHVGRASSEGFAQPKLLSTLFFVAMTLMPRMLAAVASLRRKLPLALLSSPFSELLEYIKAASESCDNGQDGRLGRLHLERNRDSR